MNKGFTLMELLSVLMLLGIISIIATVSIGNVMVKSRDSLSDVQKKEIERAAEVYYLKEGINSSDFETENYETCVNVTYLIDGGYVDAKEINDPSSNDQINGSVKITYNSNQYVYKYQDELCAEDTFNVQVN